MVAQDDTNTVCMVTSPSSDFLSFIVSLLAGLSTAQHDGILDAVAHRQKEAVELVLAVAEEGL